MLEINEIIALASAGGIVSLIAIYEGIMHRLMRNRLREACANAASWKSLYRAVAEERDLLDYRVKSRDCQKVLCIQEKLDEARAENEQLRKLNETYKQQIERNSKKKEK